MRLAIFIRCLKNMCIGLNGIWYWLFTEFRVTELFRESRDINATTHRNVCFGLDERANAHQWILFVDFILICYYSPHMPAFLVKNTSLAWDINATTHRNVCFGLDERANAHQWILFVDFILICYYSPHMPAFLVKNTSLAWQTRPTDPYWPATDPPIRTIWGGLRREQ